MRCPKCGFEQEEGPECVRCGVIFGRLRKPPEPLPEPVQSVPAPPAPLPVPAIPPESAVDLPAPPDLPPVPPVPPTPPESDGGDGDTPSGPGRRISLAGAALEIFRVFFTFGPRLLLVAMLLDILFAPLLYYFARWAGLGGIPVTELPHNPIFRPVGVLIVNLQYVNLWLHLGDAARDRLAGLVRDAVLFYPFSQWIVGLLVQQLVLAWRGISLKDRLRRGLSSLLPLSATVVVFHLLLLVLTALPISLLLLYLVPTPLGILFFLAVGALCLANGIRVGIKYGLAIPLAALERDGVLTAFRRSATLTRGRRLRIASLLLLPFLAHWLEPEVHRSLIALHFQSALHGYPFVRSLEWVFQVLGGIFDLFFAATLAVLVERLAGDPVPGREPLAGHRLLPRAAAFLLGAPVLFVLAGFVLPYPSLSYYIGRASMSVPDRQRFDRTKNAVPLPESRVGGGAEAIARIEHETRAIRALGRCLDAYRRRTRSGYPRDLSAVGPSGIGCAERELAENRDPKLVITYHPGKPDEHGQITTYGLSVGQAGSMGLSLPLNSDETSLLFVRANRDTVLAENFEVIQGIDAELQRFRQAHPEKKYPRSLAELDRASDPNQREIQRGIEAGRLDGYRYLYTPGPVDSAGQTSTYRLEVRPVRYGAPTKYSSLCDPQGKLWTTSEDRPAEPTDPEVGKLRPLPGESGR
jgi:hypothetical protein